MKMIKGYTFRLAPTPAQAALIEQFAGVCRLVYNLALEQRSVHAWQVRRATGFNPSYFQQCGELTLLRAEFDFIRATPQEAQQRALKDLDRAFSAFFAGGADYPTYRRRGVDETFRIPGRAVKVEKINRRWSRVRLPKIGWVRYRDSYGGPETMLAGSGVFTEITISLRQGSWNVSIGVKRDVEAPEHPARAGVGIDRGVAVPLALSDGQMIYLPKRLKRLERQKRRAERTLSRRKKGSNRRAAAKMRLSNISARIARIRKDWAHKVTTSIVREYSYVAVEALQTKSMTRSAKGTAEKPGVNVAAKAGLNREILNVGWYQIEQMLAYKLEWAGGHLEKVPAAYTSQTCSACGTIDKGSRESQARFSCRHCGHEINADLNAARNIIMRASSPYLGVEACGCAACEASTSQRAA
jgi:putative transposase